MPTSDDLRVLVHALDQAADELDHVQPDRLSQPTPCGDWDVATLADHLVAAPAKFVTMMRGEQPDWTAPPPHVRESWGAEFRVHADDLSHAWHELEGDPPTPVAWQVAEIAVHTWDLVTALGRPTDRLDPEVAQVALDFMRSSLQPEMRDPAFGPEQTPAADAGPYEKLAAFAGRAAG
jgi:uncharacterized protein (TIGR03086 family)